MGTDRIHTTRTRALRLRLLLLIAGLAVVATPASAGGSQWHWDGVDRVVAVPDVHGAYDAFVRLLQASEVIDENLAWRGGKTHLVSLGDLLDRGPDSKAVMDLLMRLQSEAKAAGGYVHVVAGNHELMNMIGDLRYVSTEEFAAFIDEESAAEREAAWLIFREASDVEATDPAVLRARFEERFPPGFFGHRRAFSARGRYGRWIASLPVVITINDTAYAHGGLPPNLVGRSLAEINSHYSETILRYLTLWQSLIAAGVLPDETGRDPSVVARSVLGNSLPSDCVKVRVEECTRVEQAGEDGVWRIESDLLAMLDEFVAVSDDPILGADSPMWYRGTVYCRPLFERPILESALKTFNVSRLVVGHTTTDDRRVHALYDERLIMVDTGMLVDYYRGRPSALILEGGQAVVQQLDPVERSAPVIDAWPIVLGLTPTGLRQGLSGGEIDVSVTPDVPTAVRVRTGDSTLAIPATLFPASPASQVENVLAAHALDRLIGIDLVPVTVPREIDGAPVALQFRDTDWVSEATRQEKGLRIGGWCGLERQYQLMYAWDLLIDNRGRRTEDMLYDPSLGLLRLTGHTDAFSTSSRLPRGLKDGVIRISPELAAALAALDRDALGDAVGAYLSKRQIRALLSRRDELLERFSGERAAAR